MYMYVHLQYVYMCKCNLLSSSSVERTLSGTVGGVMERPPCLQSTYTCIHISLSVALPLMERSYRSIPSGILMAHTE